MEQQVCVLYALVNGILDDVEIPRVQGFEDSLHSFMNSNHPELLKSIADAKEISDEIDSSLKAALEEFKSTVPY
jgi:F-type H+-transporting ATPase subunit alpha